MTEDQPPAAQPADVEPTGRQIELNATGYRAVVTEVGGRLRELSWNGRHLVRTFAADQIPPLYSGAVLAPWPNRLAGGSYSFRGRPLQVPINEVDRTNACTGWSPTRSGRSPRCRKPLPPCSFGCGRRRAIRSCLT